MLTYAIYAYLPNFCALLFFFIPYIYGTNINLKLNKNLCMVLCFIFTSYIVSWISLEFRYVGNLVSSGKILVFLIFCILASNSPKLFYGSFSDFSKKYISFGFAYCGFGIFLYAFVPDLGSYGMRGDVGVMVSLFSFLTMSNFTQTCSKKNLVVFFLMLLMSLTFLIILQGRTALGVLAVCLLFGYLHGRKVRQQRNFFASTLVFAALFVTVAGGILLISARGGLEYLLNAEARLHAVVYWHSVMLATSNLAVLLGHGYGYCADAITLGSDWLFPHVNQITASSGGNCYVAWGFHNTILATIFEIGFVGLILIIVLIWRTFKGTVREERVILYFLLALIFVASPNNHLLNNDLFGTLIFATLAYYHSTRLEYAIK